MKTAIYPGSFDPITNGHVDIVERAAKLFDKIIIAVGKNMEKDSIFSTKERVALVKDAVKHLKNVTVDSFDGLMLDYAKKAKANVIVRGLRAVSDFDYEFQMALMNRKLNKNIETVFIMTSEKYVFLSASLVKELAEFNGDISALVPKKAEQKLKAYFR